MRKALFVGGLFWLGLTIPTMILAKCTIPDPCAFGGPGCGKDCHGNEKLAYCPITPNCGNCHQQMKGFSGLESLGQEGLSRLISGGCPFNPSR